MWNPFEPTRHSAPTDDYSLGAVVSHSESPSTRFQPRGTAHPASPDDYSLGTLISKRASAQYDRDIALQNMDDQGSTSDQGWGGAHPTSAYYFDIPEQDDTLEAIVNSATSSTTEWSGYGRYPSLPHTPNPAAPLPETPQPWSPSPLSPFEDIQSIQSPAYAASSPPPYSTQPAASTPEISQPRSPAPRPQSEDMRPFVRGSMSTECFKSFTPLEKEILAALTAKPGELIPLSKFSTITKLEELPTRRIIHAVNTKLKYDDAPQILSLLPGTRTPKPMYVLEPEHPNIIRKSPQFELMRNSLSGKDAQGYFHDIAIRDDEFYVLQLLIDRETSGASSEDIKKHLIENSIDKKIPCAKLISQLNARMRNTTLSIKCHYPEKGDPRYIFKAGYQC